MVQSWWKWWKRLARTLVQSWIGMAAPPASDCNAAPLSPGRARQAFEDPPLIGGNGASSRTRRTLLLLSPLDERGDLLGDTGGLPTSAPAAPDEDTGGQATSGRRGPCCRRRPAAACRPRTRPAPV